MDEKSLNSMLKRAITFDFVHHVKPVSFLLVVHSVNLEILTSNDLSNIKAETSQKGDIQGAYKLLDCLTLYDNWFDCVIKVLEHPEIKLKAVASKLKSTCVVFTKMHGPRVTKKLCNLVKMHFDSVKGDDSLLCIYIAILIWKYVHAFCELSVSGVMKENLTQYKVDRDEINSKCMNKTIVHHYSASKTAAESASLQWMILNRPSDTDPLSTMELQADDADDKEESEIELEPAIATTNPTQVFLEEKNIAEPRDSCTGSSEEQCAVSIAKNVMTNPRKKAKHGPEYDFTDDEIIDLHACKGWHPQVNEMQVREILDGKLCEDGHFLIFYWERKKRPAISVTYGGNIKTFIIHKKPANTVGSNTLYFIDRNGQYDENLKTLINSHFQKGIVNMSTPHPQSMISLSSPISAKQVC